jgi:hypothetical protein
MFRWPSSGPSPRRFVSPLTAGLVLGGGAAFVQAFGKVVPPEAYGVCMVCHPRDLLNWLGVHLAGMEWEYSFASAEMPLLTAIGVPLGALLAAYLNGELRLEPARRPLWNLTCGFVVINLGLVLGSCPVRLVLLTAYGSLTGLLEWVGVAAGIVCATLMGRWLARRSAGGMEM